MYDLL
jgi:hypothetical protein